MNRTLKIIICILLVLVTIWVIGWTISSPPVWKSSKSTDYGGYNSQYKGEK